MFCQYNLLLYIFGKRIRLLACIFIQDRRAFSISSFPSKDSRFAVNFRISSHLSKIFHKSITDHYVAFTSLNSTIRVKNLLIFSVDIAKIQSYSKRLTIDSNIDNSKHLIHWSDHRKWGQWEKGIGDRSNFFPLKSTQTRPRGYDFPL